jgi:hypothetical protein
VTSPWRNVGRTAAGHRIDSRLVVGGGPAGTTTVQVRAWVEGKARELAEGPTLQDALAALALLLLHELAWSPVPDDAAPGAHDEVVP